MVAVTGTKYRRAKAIEPSVIDKQCNGPAELSPEHLGTNTNTNIQRVMAVMQNKLYLLPVR